MKICIWQREDEGDEFCESWTTGCGKSFIINDETPSECYMKFCMFCGRQLKEQNDKDDSRRSEEDYQEH